MFPVKRTGYFFLLKRLLLSFNHLNLFVDKLHPVTIHRLIKKTNLILKFNCKMKKNLICTCNGVTHADIRKSIHKKRATCFEEVQLLTRFSAGCGRCTANAKAYTRQELKKQSPQKQLSLNI